ncbi:hypothetical protein QQF64_011349 [Cirrhinus molitorella]|uniref:Uncharacterized protein n=1 Tax=Cirrhinus molitorella TaxID=172907 RepID=A0ABR3LZX2_9TELE
MDACNLCYKQIQLQWQVGRCARDGSEDVEQQSHDESKPDNEWEIGLSLPSLGAGPDADVEKGETIGPGSTMGMKGGKWGERKRGGTKREREREKVRDGGKERERRREIKRRNSETVRKTARENVRDGGIKR